MIAAVKEPTERPLYRKQIRPSLKAKGLGRRARARRPQPPAKPKLDPFIAMIDRIFFDDKSRPRKQQHTAKRIFERLRDEYGFTGGLTIVKAYVAGWRQRA